MKVQFQERIHKISSDVKTLEGVLKQVHLIFREKLPAYFSLRYRNGNGADAQFVPVRTERDLQQALTDFRDRCLKIEIVEESSEAHDKLLTSRLKAEAESEEHLLVMSAVECSRLAAESSVKPPPLQQPVDAAPPISNNGVQLAGGKKIPEDSNFNFNIKQEIAQALKLKNGTRAKNGAEDAQPAKSEDPYTCFKCLSGPATNLSCEFCAGSGQIPPSHWIIRLIQQVFTRSAAAAAAAANNNSQGASDSVKAVTMCTSCSANLMHQPRFECPICDRVAYCQRCFHSEIHKHRLVPIDQGESRAQRQPQPPQEQASERVGPGQVIATYFKSLLGLDKGTAANQGTGAHAPSDSNVQNAYVFGSQSRVGKSEFKAQFEASPISVINAHGSKNFEWSVNFRNNGKKQWPLNTYLYCIGGCYLGVQEKVKALQPGESEVIRVMLQAPEKGKHTITWRLGYTNGEGDIVNFGPRSQFELVVASSEPNGAGANSAVKGAVSVADSGIVCRDADSIKINKLVLEKAEKLAEFFGGNVKDYVKFIEGSRLQDKDIQTLSNLYMSQKQYEEISK